MLYCLNSFREWLPNSYNGEFGGHYGVLGFVGLDQDCEVYRVKLALALVKVLHQEIPKTSKQSLECHFILYYFIFMSVKTATLSLYRYKEC